MKKIQKLLVANRGEIARRIIRTCKRLSIQTVAVFSIADRNSPFVKDADEAYPLGGPEASSSYLNIELLIEIAKKSGVDAIHPGYGFLSENPEFCRRVESEKILFIGPSSDAIHTMGDKVESRKKMIEAGVPVIPGYDGGNQDPEFLLEKAKEIGFPVMIKANAGGGGRGMRRVWNEVDFHESLESAKREAASFFKNNSVFIEKLVTNPRHIEVQVFGDNAGNVIHFFERDCSVQRRNQKVIEEAPAIGLSDELRNKIHNTAILATKSIGYRNAGTVEFVLSGSGEFYFLEMNTRLQVEHPVTEMITGKDLIELQIRIAEGESIPYSQDEIDSNGHAFELRICAEEGGMNPVPGTGEIRMFLFDEDANHRLDTGVENGSLISIYYDSMIAKLITYGKDREESRQRAVAALSRFIVLGIPINYQLLNSILTHSEFIKGGVNTGFLDEYYKEVPKDPDEFLILAHAIQSMRIINDSGDEFSKTNSKVYFLEDRIWNDYETYQYKSKLYKVRGGRNTLSIWESGSDEEKVIAFESLKFSSNQILYFNSLPVYFVRYGNKLYIHHKGKSEEFEIELKSLKALSGSKNSLKSPMPGKIISIKVLLGQSVHAGDPLIVVEAMKMENLIRSTGDFLVEEICFQEGDLVKPEDELIKLKPIHSEK